MSLLLTNADAARIPLPDKSVQCVVTSPPYWGLRKYEGVDGTVWPSVTYAPMPGMQSVTVPGDAECEHVWGEELPTPGQKAGNRPDRPSGFQQKGSAGQEGALSQMRGSDATGGRWCQCCGAWRGMLGLEPTPEMYVAHMVLVFRELWRVLRDDGACWLNLGDSYAGNKTGDMGSKSTLEGGKTTQRVAGERPSKGGDGLKQKDLCGIPWRVAFALQADGWYLRSDIIWAKGLSFCDSYAGSCMPESVRDRPTKAHEYLFLLAKSKRYYYDQEAVKEAGAGTPHAPGNIGQRRIGERAQTDPAMEPDRVWAASGTRNLRDVWTINPAGYPGSHYAVFPEELVEPCIKAGTSEQGACPECGAPWERVVEKEKPPASVYTKTEKPDEIAPVSHPLLGRVGMGQKLQDWYDRHPAQTTGWQPTCDHDAEPVPCVVLDPFAGRGTTAKVARDLGRDCVLLDLSEHYLRENAMTYLELDKLKAWNKGNGRAQENYIDLPMFKGAV